MHEPSVSDPPVIDKIHELISYMGGRADTYEGELVTQLIQTSLKVLTDKMPLGQLKLVTRALKEMRYAYKTFNQYPKAQRLAVFGSARTPEGHPDYHAALALSRIMAENGWMCITGAAEGIMKAGLEGAHQDHRFGLSIKLPWESQINELIDKDPKLIMFRYFFTRKLMFVSHAHAFAAFPGGYGTMDELFEVLTLMQTGKAEIMPVVLVEGSDRDYWRRWENYVNKHLLANGWICPQDKNLYYYAKNEMDAAEHILKFYAVYHSSRYVKDYLVIRLKKELPKKKLIELTQEFISLISEGKIEACLPFPEESDFLDKPRIAFKHTRKDYGLLRTLIDRINE
jgi:uncharacterized protein (TIGR00730 family)